ncbi:hypothetical protein [Rhizobium sp. BK068]|uniref:hypothetical protein n=1 Tax=Rhizobium sp. BK068 TaxID=2512130 RepID=UPI001045AFF1|nr:hypothetical protein [Rhizobium sp. BK068]TCM62366.1 hypothetical protein EV291_15311 [Rhizobium sp. BK068]
MQTFKLAMMFFAVTFSLGAESALALTGNSTFAEWSVARGDDQMALARDMVSRTIGGGDGVVVDLMFCIEKAAGEMPASSPISEVAATCLVLLDTK